MSDTFSAIRSCAIAMLAGRIVQADRVSAGNGAVIDWRSIRSGETIQEDADAFDAAQLFVALVGAEAAARAVAELDIEPAPPVRVQPRISAYMLSAHGGRRRSFEVGGFTVIVEPHEDDAAQAAFTAHLASLCEPS